MANNRPTTKERISTALRMGQEPIDRLWAAIYVLLILILVLGATTVLLTESTRSSLRTHGDIEFQRGSVLCLSLINDNDLTFGFPSYCKRSEVVVYYPPEICDEFFHESDLCGRDWEEV